MTLSISLSPAAEAKLREKASAGGQPLEAYATQVLEKAAAASSIEDILAPIRKQVADSGMRDDEFDSLVDEVRDEVFSEGEIPRPNQRACRRIHK